MNPTPNDKLDLTAKRVQGYVDSAHHNILKTLEIRTDSLHTHLNRLSASISNVNYKARLNQTRLEKHSESLERLDNLLSWAIGLTLLNLATLGAIIVILVNKLP